MNLKDVNSVVSFWLGKKKPGFTLTKPEFERLLHLSQLKHLKRKIGLPEEYQPGAPLPKQVYEISNVIMDDLSPFKRVMGGDEMALAIDMAGYTNVPKDFYYPSTLQLKLINSKTGKLRYRKISIVTDKEWADRLGSFSAEPNRYFPVANFQNKFIRFYPKDLRSADFVYISTPVKPVYGVTYGRGFAEYVPSTSTELAWNDTNIIDIMGILLGEIGVNIPNSDLINISDKAEVTGT